MFSQHSHVFFLLFKLSLLFKISFSYCLIVCFQENKSPLLCFGGLMRDILLIATFQQAEVYIEGGISAIVMFGGVFIIRSQRSPQKAHRPSREHLQTAMKMTTMTTSKKRTTKKKKAKETNKIVTMGTWKSQPVEGAVACERSKRTPNTFLPLPRAHQSHNSIFNREWIRCERKCEKVLCISIPFQFIPFASRICFRM